MRARSEYTRLSEYYSRRLACGRKWFIAFLLLFTGLCVLAYFLWGIVWCLGGGAIEVLLIVSYFLSERGVRAYIRRQQVLEEETERGRAQRRERDARAAREADEAH